MKKIIMLIVLMIIAIPFVVAEPSVGPSFKAIYEETGLTIVTGTISGESVEGFPVTVYCLSDEEEFMIGTSVSNTQGLFSVVYNNNNNNLNELFCQAGDTVWAQIDNTEFKSRYVIVEDVGPYDYADADIDVPEFGILAMIGIIGLAGMFIYKRRD